MNLLLFQEEVFKWASHNFPTDNFEIGMLGLVEEVGEVCRGIVKRQQKLRGTYEEWTEEIEKELGDVFIKLVHVFVLYDPSFGSTAKLVEKRWDTIKQRDWIKYPKNGLTE